ncbi:MAG: hypothetical protein ACOC2M_00545 [bacterium]
MKKNFINDLLNLIPILDSMIYGDKAKVLIKQNYGKYETYYYDLDENRKLLIHDKEKTPEKAVHNPKILGKPTYDEDGRLICNWVYGEPFGYFMNHKLDSEEILQKVYNELDDKVNQVLTTGITIGMNRVKGVKKGLFEDPMIYVVLGTAVIALATAFMVYTGFKEQGIDIFAV